jgi:hypothetical protein
MWNNRFRVGDLSAAIAWSYYKGKRFKGIEFSGETGVGAKHVNFIIDLKFKVKRYKSDGETRSYIGGKGSARLEALGYTFTGVGVGATSRKFYAYVNPPGPVGRKKITLYFKDITSTFSAVAGEGDALSAGGLVLSDTHRGAQGVASWSDPTGATLVLLPEARLIDRVSHSAVIGYALDSAVLNLAESVDVAAITMDYQSGLGDVRVELPGGEIRDVVISEESTVQEPGKLYALDYALDDTTRQLLVEIENAGAGDYTLAYNAEGVSATAIYELLQVPEIDEDGVSAFYANGEVDLQWQLKKAVSGDVKYHLSLHGNEDGELIAQYPLYENEGVDADLDGEVDGDEIEQYIEDAALAVTGTTFSTRVKLPANLKSGTYAFSVEPVLNRDPGEDDLESERVISNSFSHVNPGYGGVVTAPVNVAAVPYGNGVVRVEWLHDPSVFGWDVVVRNQEDGVVGALSISQSDLLLGKNLYVGPGLDQYVFINIGIESNAFASLVLTEGVYDTDYRFEVSAVQQIPHAGGPYFNPVEGYVDMNNIESSLNESLLVYRASAAPLTARFLTPRPVRFSLELLKKGGASPRVAAKLYEENIGEIGFEYDPEADLETEQLRRIDFGALVMITDLLDVMRLIPDIAIARFGFSLIGPDGNELLHIPPLTVAALCQPGNWVQVANEIASRYPDIAADTALLFRLQQLYLSGAVTQDGDGAVRIDFTRLVSLNLVPDFVPGRYTASVKSYNSSEDEARTVFEVVVRDLSPFPVIDSIQPLGNNLYRITGMASGIRQLMLNGQLVVVDDDGTFEAVIELTDAQIEVSMTDLFGNSVTGIIQIPDFEEIRTWFASKKSRRFWMITLPAITNSPLESEME